VSSKVAAVVEGLIDAEEVGPLALKGFLKPVPAFSVLGLKPRP
jgi:class 3 adenylate cyclase